MDALRRHWIQVGGIMLAAALVTALALVTTRGGGTGPVAVTPRPTPVRTAVPTSTPDPRVDEVKAAAKAYIDAENEALKTGKPDQLIALTVDGSQAQGLSGNPVAIAHQGKTFIVTSTSYKEFRVDVLVETASVHLKFDVTGFDASWPSLERRGPDRIIKDETAVFGLVRVGGRWLIDTLR